MYDPDLFWALKDGGGGSFGVVSRMTLRLHDLPEFFGFASFTVKATSDDAYRRLISEFVSFYRKVNYDGYWRSSTISPSCATCFAQSNPIGQTLIPSRQGTSWVTYNFSANVRSGEPRRDFAWAQYLGSIRLCDSQS